MLDSRYLQTADHAGALIFTDEHRPSATMMRLLVPGRCPPTEVLVDDLTHAVTWVVLGS